jgi:hypothetical protein
MVFEQGTRTRQNAVTLASEIKMVGDDFMVGRTP